MKKVTLILFSLAVILTAGWWRTYGGNGHDYGQCVRQLSEGYIVTGGTYSFGNGGYDLWLLRIDENGGTLWTKTYGGEKFDWGNYLEITADGGFIITGMSESFGGEDYDLLIIKTDESGELVWSRTYGSLNEDWGNYIECTTDGGFIITGKKTPGYQDLWLLKIDSLGDTLWTRCYRQGGYSEGYCVKQTNDNGYIVAGNTERQYVDLWLLKTDENGDSIWTLTYNWGWSPDGYETKDVAFSVLETQDGSFIACGVSGDPTESGGEGWTSLILKTDSQGNIIWVNRYKGYVCSNTIRQVSEGYILSGYTSGQKVDVLLFLINEQGQIEWSNKYGGEGHDFGSNLDLTSDGGFIVTGVADRTYYGEGTGDLFLLKTDSLGLLAVSEQPSSETLPPSYQLEIASTIGREVTLRYSNCPNGLRASVFDALGRKVDEITAGQTSGALSWGECHSPGVYFIREMGEGAATHKVVLIR